MSVKIVWGICGFLLLILAVWGIVHWQAEPGAQIGFGSISYTKPGALDANALAQKLSERLSDTHRLTLSYTEPCSELTMTDTNGNFARFDIRTTITLDRKSPEWVIEKSSPKHTVVLLTPRKPSFAVDTTANGSALGLFERLKSACSSE